MATLLIERGSYSEGQLVDANLTTVICLSTLTGGEIKTLGLIWVRGWGGGVARLFTNCIIWLSIPDYPHPSWSNALMAAIPTLIENKLSEWRNVAYGTINTTGIDLEVEGVLFIFYSMI